MIIDYKDKTLILRHEQDDSLYDPSSRAEWMKLKVVLASNFKTCPVCKDGSLTLSEYMATRCTAAYDKYSPHKGTYETVHRIYCNGNHQMNVVKFMVNKKAVFFRHEFVVPVVETNARIPTVQPIGDTGFAAIPLDSIQQAQEVRYANPYAGPNPEPRAARPFTPPGGSYIQRNWVISPPVQPRATSPNTLRDATVSYDPANFHFFDVERVLPTQPAPAEPVDPRPINWLDPPAGPVQVPERIIWPEDEYNRDEDID